MACIIHIVELTALWKINGWWLDELMSITATGQKRDFASAFQSWITTDSNPPLYYTALYAVRTLVPDGRFAFLITNEIATVAAAATVALASRRAGVLAAGLICIGAVLLSGPIVRYSMEARAYLLAMQLVFVASWFSGLALREVRPPHMLSFGAVGVLNALAHVFAGLMCGALAAGMLMATLREQKAEVRTRAIALGVGVGLAWAIWLPFGIGTVHNVDWITFSFKSTVDAAKVVGSLTIGSAGAALELIIGCGFVLGVGLIGLIDRATRSLTLAFALALILFVIIPIAISFQQPIIVARYWEIGFPVVITLAILVLTPALHPEKGERSNTIRRTIGLVAGVSFLIACGGLGYRGAERSLTFKTSWKGAPVVTIYAVDCPARSIHVLRSLGWLYGEASGLRPDLFVDATSPATPTVEAADAKCRILGWAEHDIEFIRHPAMSDDLLLRALKIDATPEQVEIQKHFGGYVVLRRQ